MSTVLVIGLSGQVGEALCPMLLARAGEVMALSRWPQPACQGVEWLLGSLEAMPEQALSADVLISLGPLDAFANWYASQQPAARRIIALSSTGREDKLHSADAAERGLASRLAASEAVLFASASARGAAATVLRPSLLYGAGRDRTLTPAIELARRWRWLPLPRSATGLRQPVHVADVAQAVLASLDSAASAGQAYDLPGGETLAFDAMLARALARHAPGCRPLRLPVPVFRLAARLAQMGGWNASGLASMSRWSLNQLADASPARRDLSYAPRAFQP